MLGGSGPGPGGGGGGEPGAGELLTVTVVRDEHGYGMKVSGDNPVYVQSVKEHGAAWRAGLRAGDRILCVDSVHVYQHTHQQVVHMIRAKPTTVLTVQQNSSRNKTPITAPLPVNPENQRQLEESKVLTMRLMLQKEQKYIRELRNEVQKVPDVRKQAQLEAAIQRCSKLQHEIDTIMAAQGESAAAAPAPPPGTPRSFLSGLPRSLSNLTGQSLRNLRNARARHDTPLATHAPHTPHAPHAHHASPAHNTHPLVPTTCLDNAPPPLPPRSTERPKRGPLSPTHPSHPTHPAHLQPGHDHRLRRSSHSLDGELDGPQPNSIALQMSYPLVNVPPPPLQTDRGGVPVLHARSQSSPEQLEHDLSRSSGEGGMCAERAWEPPGTPPPPYAHNTQPCVDSQRAIISMEEDDPPTSMNSSSSGLFCNLRSVRDSRARMAVLLNWLIGERRCPYAWLVLVLTEQFRSAAAPAATLRRWAYEIHSSFLMPHAVLQLNGVDEHMANEIDHVLLYEYHKEEVLRNVFRKARAKAKEELAGQLRDFQLKRQVGLGALYGPDDAVLDKCTVDKAQEQVVVERLLYEVIRAVCSEGGAGVGGAVCGAPPPAQSGAAPPQSGAPAHRALLAALAAAACSMDCRPAAVAAAGQAAGARESFLLRDKLYKQRLKHIAKQRPQPYVVRGHQLQLQALTSVAHCHHCDLVIWGLAPQAYVCANCNLRVHRECGKAVEEGCVLDGETHNNRISRFMERIHHNNMPGQDTNDKKSRKASGTSHFLNMERSLRKMEDEATWEQTLTPTPLIERRDESDESLYESADCHSDAVSASDDALPRLSHTPTISKESLKLAVTDEEAEHAKTKRGHRKTMSLSNPLEMVKNLGDEWFDHTKKDLDKNYDKRKSRESLWSEEDRDSIHGSTMKLDQIRKNSKKEDKSNPESRKGSATDISKPRKGSKGSSVSALNFLRRKKTPTSSKSVDVVLEIADRMATTEEILNYTKFFLEEERRHTSLCQAIPIVETDSDDDPPPPKLVGEHRRRLSRQTSRSKSKVRGKSQSVKVNTLRKSHSGTLKKGKKKSVKAPSTANRSRQSSIADTPPIQKKRNSDTFKQHSWLFSTSTHKGESRREGSTEEPSAPEADGDAADNAKEQPDLYHRGGGGGGGGRGVNRAESCRERDAPRRGKHRNASDPNRLTAHHNHDLEPGTPTAPSGSSSSSSLSSRSNESNTVAADQQELSEEEEPLAAQWADSLPPHLLDTLLLSARLRKRQEVIHELIVSEGSHVRWLKVLDTVFHRPLLRAPALLAADDVRALFPNLQQVRERHARLYADLRAARALAADHVVQIRPVAEALLSTLGEAGYAGCLARFCRGQRLALEALRERRRKHKELHQFLCGREQLPLCGRLQLRDLLACVWQRLTKYQLLLEGILKTVGEGAEAEGGAEAEAGAEAARRALAVAKDVLQTVDAAIRTAENEHRLRSIQSKLEVRAGGAEWEELRRLDLTARALRLEGDLALRNDSSKRVNVLALLLSDCLVLLQREGERFVLRPISQPSQQGPLSPLIKWDKVLFRPNAAVRNTFFLMNINGVQMHELSANTAAEYATWVKHIQQAPLAKLTELKPLIAHHHSRSNDDSGINVSRNPSDASEKSSSTAPDDDRETERDTEHVERDTERDAERDVERDSEHAEHEHADTEHAEHADRDRASADRLDHDRDDKRDDLARDGDSDDSNRQRRATVGRISTHCGDLLPALAPPHALTVRDPPAASLVHTARRALTHQERLRRLDEVISRALRAKSCIVGELLGVPADSYAQVADLAVAETLGQVDMSDMELAGTDSEDVDIHQLLLAAHEQANQLTELLAKALTVEEASAMAARSGRCDSCRRAPPTTPRAPPAAPPHHALCPDVNARADPDSSDRHDELAELEDCLRSSEQGEGDEGVYDLLLPPATPPAPTSPPAPTAPPAVPPREPAEPPFEALQAVGAARLARRLGVPARALAGTLARLLAHAPPQLAHAHAARQQLAAQRDLADALRAQARHAHTDYQMSEEICFPKALDVDRSLQDHPSNGG